MASHLVHLKRPALLQTAQRPFGSVITFAAAVEVMVAVWSCDKVATRVNKYRI